MMQNLSYNLGKRVQRQVYLLTKSSEWPSGLYSLRQVTEVKLGRVRSDFEMGDH